MRGKNSSSAGARRRDGDDQVDVGAAAARRPSIAMQPGSVHLQLSSAPVVMPVVACSGRVFSIFARGPLHNSTQTRTTRRRNCRTSVRTCARYTCARTCLKTADTAVRIVVFDFFF